jgi:DNA-binding transcriptional LysR family regulator
MCLLIVPIGLALAVSILVAPVYAVRYVSPVGLAFAFLLARGGIGRHQRVATVMAAIAVLPMLLSLWFLYFDPGYGRADLRGAARLVEEQRRPDEIALHLASFTAAPFDYYRVAQPGHVLETDTHEELCQAVRAHMGGWLVTAYAPDDDDARGVAEAGIMRADYAADLIDEPPQRLVGVSLFRLRRACNV